MKQLLTLTIASLVACGGTPAPTTSAAKTSAPECTEPVTRSLASTFPGSTAIACKDEVEDGHHQFEVKLTKSEGTSAEVDVAPDGTILQIEEAITILTLPTVVSTAFATKYPNLAPTRAEKQTRPGKGVFFEIAFTGPAGKKEATFSESGAFVEEE